MAPALFVCGISPAWFVSDSLGLLKFYTVYIHQTLIFEWVTANLFICHLHYLFPSPKCWFETGQTAEWYLTSVNYWLVTQYYVQFVQQIKMQNKNSWAVETANSFYLHKLLGTDIFLPAHLTLHEFCFLGRKDILWFHLQMARRIIVPVGFINQAFGLLGNTFIGDWCQFCLGFFFFFTLLWLVFCWSIFVTSHMPVAWERGSVGNWHYKESTED